MIQRNSIGHLFTGIPGAGALKPRFETYTQALGNDGTAQDDNPRPDQVEIQQGDKTYQFLFTPDTAMARVLNGNGQTEAVEEMGESLTVATRSADGAATAQDVRVAHLGGVLVEDPLIITPAENPEQRFNDLNDCFAREWKMAGQ